MSNRSSEFQDDPIPGSTLNFDVNTEYDPRRIVDSETTESSDSVPLSDPNVPAVNSPSPSSLRATSRTRPNRLTTKSQPMLRQPLQLTFGVEIECVVMFRPE